MRLNILLVALAVSAVAGCSLKRDLNKAVAGAYGASPETVGQVITPKMCKLTVAIISRPLGDPVVNSALWNLADEQAIGSEVRRGIESNGIRVGIITGGIPPAVETAMKAPPPNQVDPAEFVLPDGSNTLASLGSPRPTASLLLNRDGRAFGKDYKDASGWFRVTASQEGSTGVALRFSPEIHHGAVFRRFDASAVNNTTPMDFQLKDGQQEETLRDLAAGLVLEPGQVAVIGCITERKGSLGSFLFLQPEEKSDRMIQKVMIVWATRSNLGEPGSQPKSPSNLRPVEPPELPFASRAAAALMRKEDAKPKAP